MKTPCLEVLRFPITPGDVVSGERLFACGGDHDHPGFHLHSGVDLNGRRYMVLWPRLPFAPGTRVRIVRLLDTTTAPDLIGHRGQILGMDAEALPAIVNYTLRCETCAGEHYVHHEELAPEIT